MFLHTALSVQENSYVYTDFYMKMNSKDANFEKNFLDLKILLWSYRNKKLMRLVDR